MHPKTYENIEFYDNKFIAFSGGVRVFLIAVFTFCKSYNSPPDRLWITLCYVTFIEFPRQWKIFKIPKISLCEPPTFTVYRYSITICNQNIIELPCAF